jgi:hypothetical protein
VERGLPHIFFRHEDLIVARIAIQEVITLLPDTLSTNKSATGIGYSSFGVAQLKFLKSTHICMFPVFFFSTGTMLETQSA